MSSRLGVDQATPLVTVLTVVYNAGDHVENTILSVLPFLGSEVEYVIVDGGSTDRTMDVLQKYSQYFSELISEPDAGIYDAMNKGINVSRGVYIYHLNVGDRLIDLPLAALRAQTDGVACLACSVDVTGGRRFVPSVNWRLKMHNTMHHQGCFYRRLTMPKYDIKYQVFADFDLNQRLYLSGAIIKVDPACIATHDADGASNRSDRFSEVFDIVRKNCGQFWVGVGWCYFKWRGLKSRVGGYGH